MKTAKKNSSRRGMALLLVLAVLVLIAALVIGFFLSTTTELKSSKSYASGEATRHLADSAVQLAMAQIADATTGTSASGQLAWASQPGMIRTFDQSGDPGKFYKLYSSDALIVDGAGFDPAAESPPADWAARRGLFTDLNAPVLRDGRVHFPVVDPRAKSAQAGQSVEGFDYSAGVDGVVLPGGAADSQRLPMPVRWIYVLQDGALATPSQSANGVVSFAAGDPARVPSAQNPIVGRIAFWTDDDTAKVNINTASEGSFWDRPWANNTTEQNFALAIPARNEFQRYPGHPAKTSLSTVLGPFLPAPAGVWFQGISGAQLTQNQEQIKAYYDLVPRVADGGTRGGSVPQNGADGNPNPAYSAIRPDADRLYASVDEFLFSATRTPNASALDHAVLERSRFFLTAHSRAPELNLFGKPRMTLWPLQSDPAQRNVKDRLIAFCSEIGGFPFYFQRYNTSAAADPSSQSTSLDWTGVPRNQTLYRYLDELTQQQVPGFGGSFATKYPRTRRQILTEMFDQIRSGVNAYSTDLAPNYSYAPPFLSVGEGQIAPLIPPPGTPGANTHGFGRFSTLTGAAMVFFRANNAYFTTTTGTAGAPIKTDPLLVGPDNPSGVVIKPAARIGATLILNPFTVSPGFPPWSSHVTYVVTGLDKFTINGVSMGFPATLTNTVDARAAYSGQGNTGAFFGLVAQFRASGGAGGDVSKTPGVSNPVTQYAFTIPIPPAPGIQMAEDARAFDFNTDSPDGHTIRIQIFAGSGVSDLVQTIDMTFPPAPRLPIPTAPPSFHSSPPEMALRYFERFNEGSVPTKNLAKRTRELLIRGVLVPDLGGDSNIVYWARDVARGVEANATSPARGDLRAYAALSYVPANYFAPCPGYDAPLVDGLQPFTNVQSLLDYGVDGAGTGGFGYDAAVPGGFYPHFPMNHGGSGNNRNRQLTTSFTTGVLVPASELAAYAGVDGRGSSLGDREYRGSARPAVPRGLTQAALDNGAAGDWDNATGLLGDGPFINKPDEGNSATVSRTASTTNINVYSGGLDIGGGYFSTGNAQNSELEFLSETGATFSPNRQIASAVLFGSLPTGIDPAEPATVAPWQTLLFCPNPPAKTQHPGKAAPPDHLLLDLFTMPIVEPYAISEPFSTAGKVNMNYAILPFSYIRRDTGVRAVLKASRIMAIPQSVSTVSTLGPSYKDGQRARFEFRYGIDPDPVTGTLAGFEQRFQAGDVFRSASEICDIFLVPKKLSPLSSGMSYPPGSDPPSSYAATADWWDNFLLTGDNTREAPYGDIYARLTTRSNTFTVHYKVQSLRKIPGTPANQWIEGRDRVTGEIRGSTTVERAIDLGNPDLPDFALPGAPSADQFYRLRAIRSAVFSP